MEGSTSRLYLPEVFDMGEFKRDMDSYMGYMVMNNCLCGDMCNISGEEEMLSKFNKYMASLKDMLWGELEEDKKKKLMEYRVCKKINVVYEYKDGEVRFSGDIKRRVESVIEITEGMMKYGILSRRHNEYYILSSSNLFTWSNVHKVGVNDVIRFLTFKRSEIIWRNRDIMVGILRLYVGDDIKVIDKLSGEVDILEILNNNEYRVIYRRFIEVLRCIFWVYRKLVVDSVIGDSIREVTRVRLKSVVSRVMEGMTSVGEVDAISVGSTRLLSDYDVTLYGNFKLMSDVIGEFNRVMDDIYGNSSEVIFDTNVYGTSFIKLSGEGDI
jgi:hypothetical protein